MGALLSQSFNPETDVGDLKGKVILVTGGNSGIGFATIQHLARLGAKVYMGARNKDKALEAIQRLKHEGLGPGYGEVVWLDVNLSDPRRAKKAAEDFMVRETKLDVLVNNAAVSKYSGTLHNHKRCYLCPCVFTRTLLPLLKKTAEKPGSDVRIVTVSSNAMILCHGLRFRSKDDFNDRHSDSWWPAASRYVRTKLANALFATELQRRLDREGIPIIILSLHPGCVNTEGYQAYAQQKRGVIGFIWSWFGNLFLLSPSDGALNSVFAAVAPEIRANPQTYKGGHLRSVGVVGAPNKEALDEDLAHELWDTTDTILNKLGVVV
ncbi:hypothetical protein NLI96_g12075 [Meripilus lineatus]|uniref:NAD(P)-binding protein n=1 Tax=Meripilus lineatus TaxID=2056292 RepID=A0AAD5Y8J3_9APHY|nr:hypothetical protein NLI96_g12075 [Physisporinus lineatus]